MRQRDQIFDIVDEGTMMDDDSDYSGIPDALNEVFARIYGYRNRSQTRNRGGKRPSRIKKINSWQAFIKNNSKKREFRYANGKLKLKKMGIAYRKTRAYKSRKR